METVIWFIQIALGFGALLATWRLLVGPTLADRIVALDLVLLLIAGGVAAEAARTGSELFIPVLVIVALIVLAGSVVVARFIEWRDVS